VRREAEDSAGRQLRTGRSKQRCGVQSVALAAQTPTVAVDLSSVSLTFFCSTPFLDLEGGSQKATLVVLLVVISSLTVTRMTR